MKNLFTLFMLVLLCSCAQKKVLTSAKNLDATVDNQELVQLYKEDQGDRKVANIDWSVVSERDENRRKRILTMLDEGLVKTSNDYANAAMIFQHGGDTESYQMAVDLMKKAVELNPQRNKWLLAAATDRLLMSKGEPQIYGTQFRRESRDEPWALYDMDPSKITDEERKEFGVGTLEEQKMRVIMMNKKKLMTLVEEGKSVDDLVEMAKGKTVVDFEYDISEMGINSFGYQLMGAEKNDDALKVFEWNTELYPDAYNTWDSLGECLVKIGKTEEGIKAYEKSLELNPDNENATKVLSEIKE